MYNDCLSSYCLLPLLKAFSLEMEILCKEKNNSNVSSAIVSVEIGVAAESFLQLKKNTVRFFYFMQANKRLRV